VLITGCHPGECHYLEQNYKALRRYLLLRRTLAQMGIEPGRVKLVWASAAEGVRLAKEITTLVEEVRALGPLNWPERAKQMGAGFGNGTGVPEVAEEVAA
jgi:F420-non-reducing hydrogenase iron-sulfur subunit